MVPRAGNQLIRIQWFRSPRSENTSPGMAMSLIRLFFRSYYDFLETEQKEEPERVGERGHSCTQTRDSGEERKKKEFRDRGTVWET